MRAASPSSRSASCWGCGSRCDLRSTMRQSFPLRSRFPKLLSLLHSLSSATPRAVRRHRRGRSNRHMRITPHQRVLGRPRLGQEVLDLQSVINHRRLTEMSGTGTKCRCHDILRPACPSGLHRLRLARIICFGWQLCRACRYPSELRLLLRVHPRRSLPSIADRIRARAAGPPMRGFSCGVAANSALPEGPLRQHTGRARPAQWRVIALFRPRRIVRPPIYAPPARWGWPNVTLPSVCLPGQSPRCPCAPPPNCVQASRAAERR